MTFALISALTLGNWSAARVTLDSHSLLAPVTTLYSPVRQRNNSVQLAGPRFVLCARLAGMRTGANDSLTSILVGFDIQIASSARLLESIIVDSSVLVIWTECGPCSSGASISPESALEDCISQGAAPDLN
jgi:hypothetical protein